MVIFSFFSQNRLKLELSPFILHEILTEHQEDDVKFSKTEAINLKEKVSLIFL